MGKATNDISLSRRPDGVFEVRLKSASGDTMHEVKVPEGFGPSLGLAKTDDTALVLASFAFLLEREPASSILRRFSLEVIPHYFPEYRREIAERLTASAKNDPSRRKRTRQAPDETRP